MTRPLGVYPILKPLKNVRWERYCLARIGGMGKEASWREAGYTGFHAMQGVHKLEQRGGDHIAGRMLGLQTKVAEKAVNSAAVTRSEVIEGFREIILMARAGAPVLAKDGSIATDASGKELRRSDLTAMHKAFESIGKSIGLFVDVQREENFDAMLEGKSRAEIKQLMLGMLGQVDSNLHKKVEPQQVEPDPDDENDEAPTLQ